MLFPCQPIVSIFLLFTVISIQLVKSKQTVSEDNCETCKLNKEIEELKYLLRNCEDELKLYKDSIANQKEVESLSALSNFLWNPWSPPWSFFYGITSPSKRSSPLHSTVNTFLQKLGIDEKQSTSELTYVHEADFR